MNFQDVTHCIFDMDGLLLGETVEFILEALDKPFLWVRT